MTRAYGPTLDFNRLLLAELPPEDGQDRADAERGFIGSNEHAEVRAADGRIVWSQQPHAFLDADEPADTVNPSLWRQARLNRIHGLFQVSARIFQVRGFDIANITFIEGDQGLIALDALTCPDTAAAALALYRRHRDPDGRCALHSVIYSHSHGDHFGGVAGLVSQADVDAGRGKTLPMGRPSLIAPTIEITRPFETRHIDGVEIEFQLAPDTEAPAEKHFFFPAERARAFLAVRTRLAGGAGLMSQKWCRSTGARQAA